jgi:hypothetical protein
MVGKSDFRKVKIILPFIFFLFSLFFFPFIAQAQWEGAVVQRLTFDTLPDQRPHLFIDQNDKLHLFYEHGTRSSPVPWPYLLLCKTKEKGHQWSEVDTIKYFEVYHGYCVLYDCNLGIIHLLYPDAWPPDSSRLYYTNSALCWVPTVVDTTTTGCDEFQMAIDSLGFVHLVWNYVYPIDTTSYANYKVIYATNVTGEWVIQVVSPPIDLGYSGSGPSYLSVEKNGIAHIVYPITAPRPYPWVPRYLCHVYNNTAGGTVWHTDSLDGSKYGYPTQFVVDKENHLHMVSSRVVGFDCDTSYVYYSCGSNTNNSWGEPEEITKHGLGSDLFIDRKGNVHLSWCYAGDFGCIIANDVHYAKKEGGSWQFVDLLAESPPYPFDFNFVIDSEGKGHGVFVGYTDAPKHWSMEIYYLGESVTWVDAGSDQKEMKFELGQNYPNPFNSSTAIPFTIHSKQKTENSPIPTTLKIYNILGEEVRTLVDEKKKEGEYRVIWDGNDGKGKEVSSGVYFYQLRAGDYHQTKKLALVK